MYGMGTVSHSSIHYSIFQSFRLGRNGLGTCDCRGIPSFWNGTPHSSVIGAIFLRVGPSDIGDTEPLLSGFHHHRMQDVAVRAENSATATAIPTYSRVATVVS